LIDFIMAHHLKLVRVDGDLVAMLPAGLVEQLRLVDGDELTVLRDGAGYRLVKKTDHLAAELVAFEEGRERYRDVLRRLAEDD
jgi:antitoxin component of MazEF toxin-antitoxin module